MNELHKAAWTKIQESYLKSIDILETGTEEEKYDLFAKWGAYGSTTGCLMCIANDYGTQYCKGCPFTIESDLPCPCAEDTFDAVSEAIGEGNSHMFKEALKNRYEALEEAYERHTVA